MRKIAGSNTIRKGYFFITLHVIKKLWLYQGSFATLWLVKNMTLRNLLLRLPLPLLAAPAQISRLPNSTSSNGRTGRSSTPRPTAFYPQSNCVAVLVSRILLAPDHLHNQHQPHELASKHHNSAISSPIGRPRSFHNTFRSFLRLTPNSFLSFSLEQCALIIGVEDPIPRQCRSHLPHIPWLPMSTIAAVRIFDVEEGLTSSTIYRRHCSSIALRQK
jgi:hypothetical protein